MVIVAVVLAVVVVLVVVLSAVFPVYSPQQRFYFFFIFNVFYWGASDFCFIRWFYYNIMVLFLKYVSMIFV